MIRTKRGSDRVRGFTLVELLVVIAIIGILVALLLPAVQQAREAARRVQCINQVRQLTLAVANYESSNQVLPAAGWVANLPDTGNGRFNPQSGKQFSWIVSILPYIEEQAIYDRFDFTDDPSHQSYGRIGYIYGIYQQPTINNDPYTSGPATIINSLVCPSDQSANRFFIRGQTPMAKGNYAAYVSPVHVEYLSEPGWQGALGGFKPGKSKGQSLRRIKDGTSKTVLVAEVRTRNETAENRGVWALPLAGSSILSLDLHCDTSVCGSGGLDYRQPYRLPNLDNATEREFVELSQSPNSQSSLIADTVIGCRTVAARAEGMPCQNYTGSFNSASPRSKHTGGVIMSALDGHVGFVSDDVDIIALGALVAAADGTPIDSNEHLR